LRSANCAGRARPGHPGARARGGEDRRRLVPGDQRFGAGQDVFDALVRAVDAIDPAFRT